MENNYLDILKYLKEPSQKSLSDDNVLWICSQIEKYKPKRILELGASTGGSTSCYLNCIKLLGLDIELISIDNEIICLYKKGKPKIGYEVRELKNYLNLSKYQLLSGTYFPEVASSIGKFDMIIMDTVHFVPGEILDTLCLKDSIHKGTILILDDINIESRYPDVYPENVLGVSCNPIILSSLKGSLIFPKTLFPTIGGICLEENPIDEEKLLLGLCHKWNTDLDESVDIYFNKIETLYGKEYVKKLEKVREKYKYSNFN